MIIEDDSDVSKEELAALGYLHARIIQFDQMVFGQWRQGVHFPVQVFF